MVDIPGMDIELDDILHWQMPLCTLLADIEIPEGNIDGMLSIELPEISDPVAVETASSLPNSLSASDKRTSSPLWPCDLPPSVSNSKDIHLAAHPPANLFASNCALVGSSQSSSAPLAGVNSLTGSHEVEPVTPPAAKRKRTRGSRASTKRSTKVKPKPEAVVVELSKEARLPTQAEHIIRERQRRDDMAAKYLILESLLPPAAKRERAVVVEDAISFVKSLQHKRTELLKRRVKLKVAAQHQSCNGQSISCCQNKKLMVSREPPGFLTASCVKKSAENRRTDSPISSSIKVQDIMIKPNSSTAGDLNTTVKPLQIQVHFSEEEVVVEMVCSHQRPNFQSFVLQAVESFGLDVTRYSIQRLTHGVVHCIITCNKSQLPWLALEIQTSASLIGDLRRVLMHG